MVLGPISPVYKSINFIKMLNRGYFLCLIGQKIQGDGVQNDK